MDETQRSLFIDELIAANRALIALAALDRRTPSHLTAEALHECRAAYVRLLQCQTDIPFDGDEALGLQKLLDRLRAGLQSFGEDI
jgi:hypothetical protein